MISHCSQCQQKNIFFTKLNCSNPLGWGKDGGDVGLQKSSNNWMSGGGGQPDSSIGEWGGGGGTGSTQSSSSINNSRGGQNTPSSGNYT